MRSTYSPLITPYEPDPETGFSQCRTLLDVARQNLLMIIMTNPGERIMFGNFGVGLRRYLFENNTPRLRQKLRESILSQARSYAPWIAIDSVDFSSSLPEQNLLSIAIRYTVKPTNQSETIAIEVGVGETGTTSWRLTTLDSFNRATEVWASVHGRGRA